ncbi:MAG: Cof-type HAD-IIB family hydrolase [Tissierellia bacterium]|nr:Cof-type HAD-IIB family hydrolase [Tissierellia bacterium]
MIKAIFFDVDGTLLSFDTHTMPQSTRESLFKLRDKGIKLFLATGRSPKVYPKIAHLIDFQFDGYVFCNGQYVVVEEKVIHNMPLPKEDLVNLLPYFEENNIAVHFTELDYSYANLENERVSKLRELLGATYPNTRNDNPERVKVNDTYQLSAYILPDEEEEFFKQAPNLRGVRWNDLFADIIPLKGGKAVGIEKMLEHFGLEKSESMAFGDGGNDTEMLEYVEYGIAMGNAVQSAKDVSVFVTEHVDNDGIYKALVKYELVD